MLKISSPAIGGIFFAKPMMDPFQIKYGKVLSTALVLPALLVMCCGCPALCLA